MSTPHIRPSSGMSPLPHSDDVNYCIRRRHFSLCQAKQSGKPILSQIWKEHGFQAIKKVCEKWLPLPKSKESNAFNLFI